MPSRRTVRRVRGAAVAVLAPSAAATAAWVVPPEWSHLWLAVLALAMAGSFWVAARRRRGAWRRGWEFLAAWAVLTAVGEALLLLPWIPTGVDVTALASLSAAAVLVLLGVRAIFRVMLPSGALVRTFLDGWLYVGSLLATLTALTGLPGLPADSLRNPEVLQSLADLCIDLLLLGLLAGVAFRSGGIPRARPALALLAWLSITASDILQVGEAMDAVDDSHWMVVAAAMGYAALAFVPHLGRPPDPTGVFPQRLSLAAVAGPYAVATLTGALLGVAVLTGHPLTGGTLLICGSVLLALLARQALTLLDHVRLVEELAAREDHYRSLVLASSDVILVTDARGIVRYVSPSIERVLGYRPSHLVSSPLAEIVHPEDVDTVAEQVARFVATGAADARIDARVRDANGGWRHTESTVSRDRRGLVIHARDVSDRVALREQLAHLAYHDALTGLPNRALLAARVASSLRRPAGDREQVGVVFLDLDGFKTVNDSLGHEAGDGVLVEVARRLTEAASPGDTVARFGGDEFAVLVERRATRAEVMEAARRISVSLRSPFRVGERALDISASVGVAHAEDAHDVNDLLRGADLAMYRAKAIGTGRVEAYRPELLVDAQQAADLAARLVRALEERAFALLYQPVVDLATERVVGVEALVRWRTDTGVLMTPAELVRIAETSGRIEALGRWVVEEALGQAASWRRSGQRLDLSVNLSTAQVGSEELLDVLESTLRATGVPPYTLTLELTETVLLDEDSVAISRLRDLKGLGVRLALDDFGTGYSSLSYLQRLPVDVLKVDRSFVAEIGRGQEADAVVAAIIQLGRQLGLTVTAEGVETAAQAQALMALGCHRAQGFHFSGPVDAVGVGHLVAHGPLPAPRHSAPRTGISDDETVSTGA